MSWPFQPQPVKTGFTLIEVTIALGVGMFVVITAYAAIRSASQTIRAADRLALENRLLRAGFIYAMDEIDYWTMYDDPDAPAGSTSQRLRGITTDTLPATFEFRVNPPPVVPYFPKRTYGMPFTPLKDLPPPNEFADGSAGFTGTTSGGNGDFGALATDRGWSLRPGTPLLLSPTDASDLATGGAVFTADRDRGIDLHRPYQANDPATWFHGSVLEISLGRRELGRYGLFTNLKKTPLLGHGDDARDLGWRANDLATNGNSGYPGFVKYTGPFGQQTPAESRTFTRYENRILYLFEALGNFACLDYLPANTLVGVHGLVFPWQTTDFTAREEAATNAPFVDAWTDPSDATQTLLSIDEAADWRFIGITTWDWKWERPDSRRLGNNRSLRGKAAVSNLTQANGNTAIAVIPGGAYSGANVIGYEVHGTIDGDGCDVPGSQLSIRDLANRNRASFPGPQTQVYDATKVISRVMQVAPLLPLRPTTWPDLRLGVARTVVNSRFRNSCWIRWLDQATGQEVEMELTALGTTLRGARQQRHQNGGWATFYGITYDTTTGVLWDNPKSGSMSGYTTTQNNDPTLDYPANPADVPGKRSSP